MGLIILFLFALGLIVAVVTAVILHRMSHPPRKTYATALAHQLPTSPEDLGLAYQEIEVDLPGNVKTTAWLMDGQGPADLSAVIIHGFGDSRYGSQTWAPLLAKHVGKVAVYDLRGHGDSTQAAASRGLEDVGDVSHVLKQLDLSGRVVLFGYSLGSGIALAAGVRLSQEQPDRIAGVILDGTYRFGREPLAGVLRRRRIPAAPFVWLVDAWYTLHAGPPGQHDRVLFSRQLACPLLVLHGELDDLCPTASARAIADAAPDGRLVLFAQGGHLDLAQVDPEGYRQAVGTFLDSL